MKSIKTLLVYAPFCTPAVPPYSVANIAAFLKANLPSADAASVTVLDLNLEFHAERFPEEAVYYRSFSRKYNPVEYDKITNEFRKKTSEVYNANNKVVVAGKNPDMLDEMIRLILATKPDIVGFSVVYSSQAFYTYALIKELKKSGVKCVVGGPSVNSKLGAEATVLANEVELLEYISGGKVAHETLKCDSAIDFSIFDMDKYFVPEPVIPLKTSSTCYYRQCAFCTHYQGSNYYEYDLSTVKKTLMAAKKAGIKNVFLVDDMISKKRLLELAPLMKSAEMKWACQLKPTADLDKETLDTLHSSGLDMLMWGIESGCDRILLLMKKGTAVADIERVLADSHSAGIKNVAYMLFGFPTETKEEFISTIDFLKRNSENMDLVSTSVFGLQKNTEVFNHPDRFGITKITETPRTVLEPSLSYEVSSGMTQEEANKMRGRYKRTLEKLNKYPKMMNFFREHMMCVE